MYTLKEKEAKLLTLLIGAAADKDLYGPAAKELGMSYTELRDKINKEWGVTTFGLFSDLDDRIPYNDIVTELRGDMPELFGHPAYLSNDTVTIGCFEISREAFRAAVDKIKDAIRAHLVTFSFVIGDDKAVIYDSGEIQVDDMYMDIEDFLEACVKILEKMNGND